MVRFDDFELDNEAFELRRKGVVVPLQRRVFDLIAFLVAHADRVVTKEELFAEVWGGVAVSDASLAQAAKHARKALGDDADSPRFLVTTRGRGYRFAAPVERVSEGAGQPLRDEPPPRSSRFQAPRPRALVGREACMAIAAGCVREAMAGRAQLLLLSGEPGIGKTRVLDEVASLARSRGARLLAGRCVEESDGAPSLWPWIQALRALELEEPGLLAGVAADPRHALRSLFPELGDAALAPELDSSQARFRVFEAVLRLLRVAASHAPLAVSLDDLHHADAPSLMLLSFVLRSADKSPILLLAAQRPVVQEEGGARRALLSDLAREVGTTAVTVTALSPDDVAAFLTDHWGAPAPAEVARSIHEITAGNPFFLTQVARLHPLPGPLGATLSEAALRSSAGDAIRRHLDILPARCRAVLTAASVLGTDLDLRPLCKVSERTVGEVLEDVGQAILSGILIESDERAARFRFAHALIRDALYAVLPLRERMRLHELAGDALAAQDDDPAEPRAARVAHHYLRAAPLGCADRAVEYAVRAAVQAARRLDHDEAARLYERAIEALDLGPGDPKKRVEVMLALGNATFRAGNPARSRQVFEQSLLMARRLGDADKLADAALGYALEDERSAADKQRIAFLEEGLSAAAGPSDGRRALLTGRLAVAQYFAADGRAREGLARQAVALAEASGDAVSLAYALRCLHFVLLAPSTTEERCLVASEQIRLAESVADVEGRLRGLSDRVVDRLELGDVAGALLDVESYERLASALKQPTYQWTAQSFRGMRLLLSGSVDEAEAWLSEVTSGGPSAAATSALVYPLFQIRKEQGRLSEIEPILLERAARAPERAHRRSMLAHARLQRGAEGEARADLEALVSEGLPALRVDLEWTATVALLSELCGALEDKARADILRRALLPHETRHVCVGLGAVHAGPVTYYLGLLEATLGLFVESDAHLRSAEEVSRSDGARLYEAKARAARAAGARRAKGPLRA